MWKTEAHTKKENEAYINGRASEWGHLPVFATQIFMPLLFLVLKWYFVIILVILLDWVWSMFRYKYYNMYISDSFWKLNKFKFPVLIVYGFFFIAKKLYVEGAITFLWPFISILFVMIGPPASMDLLKPAIEKELNNIEISKTDKKSQQ
jgi:hypothetical protein